VTSIHLLSPRKGTVVLGVVLLAGVAVAVVAVQKLCCKESGTGISFPFVFFI